MRITSNMYYKQIQQQSSRSNKRLFDVNRQIASGIKIQYAKDDVRTFTETMRLDNEMTTLGQIKKSTESGYKMSNQADTVLNEFETSMDRVRVLLLQASNDGAHSPTSMDALAKELRGVEEHFKNLANTSINGQYLFSGSAVNVKPIAEDGTYRGNDASMSSFVGAGVEQKYNLTGGELFLGEEINIPKEITSNVSLEINNPNTEHEDGAIDGSVLMSEFMGDSPNDKHYFYLRGTKSDGTAFHDRIELTDSNTIDDLLKHIGDNYGNTSTLKVVDVSMNSDGNITVKDKIQGSSKLDFHLVGATDFSNTGKAKVDKIDDLDGGTTDYNAAVSGSGSLYIKEFVKSPFSSAVSAISNNDSLLYDRTEFSKDANKLSSNVAQVDRKTNAFASPSTKISEVADLSQGTADTLVKTTFTLKGIDINGHSYDYDVVLDKNDSNDTNKNGSYFTPDNGNTKYKIYDMDPNGRKAVDADKMTYQQLMDVMNMVVTDTIPDPAGTHQNPDGTPMTDAQEYDYAIGQSNKKAQTSLSYDGKIQFEDSTSVNTKATLALYDSNSGDFTKNPSVMTFNANNALTVRDPKTDFFKNLDEMITAVENYKAYPDSSKGDMRNVGIQNAITMLDDLMDHVTRSHSVVGAQSNSLSSSLERTQILEVSTMTLRSSVIDTDLAEASLNLNQLTINYQAMLSTIGRISKLSLVNYL